MDLAVDDKVGKASFQAVRSTGRVVFIAQAYPALRAALSQDCA